MKQRHGFVSNSSSSSFIIKKSKKYPDSYSLAYDMIPKRNWDNDNELKNKIKLETRKRKISKLNNEKVKFNCENVSFFTCNYDTYIVDFKGYLFVQTCNNHDWEELNDLNISTNLPKDIENEIIKILKNNDDDKYNYDYEYDYLKDLNNLDISFKFYSLETDKIGSRSKKFKYCSKCYTDFWEINGIDQCPKCGKLKEY
jgi:hypothetical protein